MECKLEVFYKHTMIIQHKESKAKIIYHYRSKIIAKTSFIIALDEANAD